ncbi:MAG: response regulator [Candidatus Solibacter sp.]
MSNGNGTILVVDDDPEALSLLVDVLEKENYDVQPADSGKLALVSVAAQPPDLVLLDLRMPGMDGFEVCRRIKETENGRRVPVMFISSSRDREEWAEGFALGAVDFVSKPFQREELLARVRTHVELGRLQVKLETLVAQRTSQLRYAVEQLRLEIVERRRAEQAVRESEERFRHIANAAPVIIWTSNAQGSVDFRNEHAARFTGRGTDELLNIRWCELVHPEDRENHCDHVTQALAGRERFQFEYRLRRADGEYRDMLDLATPRFVGGAEFAGFIGVVFDVTDVKRAQEQAFREKNLQNLRLLSAGIAHDFNTLVAAIFGEVDLALADMPEDAPGRENVERIDGVAKRAAEIVRLLMAYVGDRSDTNQPEMVDLNTVAREITPHLKGPPLKKAELHMNLAPHLPSIQASPLQMRLVVLNLIINAVEALQGEKGRVTISTGIKDLTRESTEECWRDLPDGRYVRLEVADTGLGMTEEVQDRMFDPFYSTKFLGRGLGLAAVQGIIRSHGGSISSWSSPGAGSTFEVLLPVEPPAPARSA